jgi:hypothetical protein
MPEGANLGRVFTIALGAEIRDRSLIVVDDRPAAALGLSASMIPLLEHSDPNRLLMGANMLRQALVPPDPEPALVQTGNEPDAPDFWCGRNLLTAFVSWGADTFADGIVVSQSAAVRLGYPAPLEPGDKLSNRHGTMGVVSRILPDDEMPHLADGTPVELAFNFSGLHVRMNFGQVREALLGRIARAEGQPAIVPAFGAPGEAALRARLAQAGLPASGMERLTLGRTGPRLERPSAVGWVYWLRLAHRAQDKLRTWPSGMQMLGEPESQALREAGAYETLREALNTRAARHSSQPGGRDGLAARVAAGPVEQALPPTPIFADLERRLQAAGIQAALEADQLTFRFRPPSEDVLKLARPVPHPWLHERLLAEIGAYSAQIQADDMRGWDPLAPPWERGAPPAQAMEAYKLVVEANERAARMVAGQAPPRLVEDALAQLRARVGAYFDALLKPDHLRFGERQLFSASAVIAPGAGLRLDQVGLGDEIAWALFGPLAARRLGDGAAVRERTRPAEEALEEAMADAWVVVHHAPTFAPTALLAFHPVRDPARVVRLPPLACPLLDADFDGDQVAVFLPLTAAAQREAGERLSVAGHLRRDPELVASLVLPPEALWGLASLGLGEAGRREIADLAGTSVEAPRGVITQAALSEAMRDVLHRQGADAALAALERLAQRGFEVVQASGASLSPFLAAGLERPPAPDGDAPGLWEAYVAELAEKILSGTDYADPDLGPQLLAVSVRARGRQHLPRLIGPRGAMADIRDQPLVVRRSHVEGLAPEELYACAAGARRGLAEWLARWQELSQGPGDRGESGRFTVLARARRARYPGIVFARAAAIGEVDPLTDADSRFLVGLPG